MEKFKQDLNYLNQVFLKDNNVLKKIIDISGLKKSDVILEIGAGKGNLTQALSKKVKKVISIEIDENLKKYLSDLPKNVEIIFADANNYLKKLIKKNQIEFNKIISNLPYNFCEPLMHLLTKLNFEYAILMAPSGFMEKMISNPVFSSFFSFEKIFKINKESFYPPPRINSEIIKITNKPDYKVDKDKKAFIIRSLYLNNKKLKNSISSTFISLYKLNGKILTKKQAKDFVSKLNLPERIIEKKIFSLPNKYYNEIAEKIIKIIN